MNTGVILPSDQGPGGGEPFEIGPDADERLAVPAIDVRLGDRIPLMFGDHARQRIRRAVDRAPAPITSIRVRLSDHHDSAVANPFVAQADIATSRAIRVQVTGMTLPEVVEALQARTRSRLRSLARSGALRWERCGPQASTLLYVRPVRQRTVVRTKSFHLYHRTAADAAIDMALMDYPFEMFHESGVRTESFLYQTAKGDYRLTRLDPRPPSIIPGDLPITVNKAPAPELDRYEALDRLALSGAPFLFYRDRALARGCVLYHRYDGYFGFITSRR
ncbi:sigma 54 modulation/S30EA ribosomal C-terminal domain-containing protein [Nocardia sp. CA2R105]|uniref:sigma 54 modulation/S30EA ribosomal C-terminal domain-containing protein n=1 Tax=Nocardia coffeae TaxID=2873381 RepID=UPI001CA6F911|nr:sigma 54 modulation/S30EA ribosomal C-terminal domain-containing protein [Nocardia coffeae]MBY8861079.1 sigma 54 modulation/S30EA ribosomal C-terminal domain-containing protein [Nocardia coffeae]